MRHARLSRGDLVNYSGVAGDANPIHWDEDIAKAAGLPDVIAHGMLTMGLGAGFASAWSGDPGAVTRYAVRLSQPAIVSAAEGADIEFSGRIKSLDPATRTGVVIVGAKSGWQEDLRPGDVERPLPLSGLWVPAGALHSVVGCGCRAPVACGGHGSTRDPTANGGGRPSIQVDTRGYPPRIARRRISDGRLGVRPRQPREGTRPDSRCARLAAGSCRRRQSMCDRVQQARRSLRPQSSDQQFRQTPFVQADRVREWSSFVLDKLDHPAVVRDGVPQTV